MLKEKLSHYESSDGIVFPKFSTIEGEDALVHQGKIKNLLEVKQKEDSTHIFDLIDNTSIKIQNINAESAEFNMLDVFRNTKIKPNSCVFLNWRTFQKIDTISFESLLDFFNDIWYPGADDIYIYDESFGWIVIITHYGAVLVLQKNPSD